MKPMPSAKQIPMHPIPPISSHPSDDSTPNRMKIPTVSIGLPVYNGSNYLRDALDSILSQTFNDFELIISDNGSTDDTGEICRSYAEKDSRIRYLRNEENLGAAWNFNRVFHLGRGKYFQWACHDDVWTSTLLERYVQVLDKMSDVVLCYSKTTYIDEHGEPIRKYISRPFFHDKKSHQRFKSFLSYHIHPNECNPVLGLFRASILEKSPLIGSYPASDMILLGDLVLQGEFHEIPEYLFLRRDHALTSVRANPDWEDRAIWFNPTCKGKIQMPRWRWFFEWMKYILLSPIDLFEKIRCFVELWDWEKWNRSEMFCEIKHGVKEWIYPLYHKANDRTLVIDHGTLKWKKH
jgi:glycosyltransferase involved in cell wall biosynthesis